MNKFSHAQTSTTSRVVEVESINEKYSAIRITESTEWHDIDVHGEGQLLPYILERKTTPTVKSGVALTSNIELYVTGEAALPLIDHEIRCLDPEYLESVQTIGYSSTCDDLGYPSELASDPFDHIKDGGVFAQARSSCHMFFDLDDVPFPVAQFFHYIGSSQITNEYYDLELVAAELLKRDDILWLHDNGKTPYHPDDDDTVEDLIHDIPYYNREEYCNKYLAFYWQPTREEYIKLWDWCVALKTEYPSTMMQNAIISHDSLNVEQFRKESEADS